MDDTLRQLASSLPPKEVPIKLRCVNCSKVAADGFRLICCASTVCGSCEKTLKELCPQCQFTLTPEIREPHTSLRRTVTVWLKTMEKKRAKQQEQPRKSTTATPVVEPKTSTTQAAFGKSPVQCACSEPSVRDSTGSECEGCGGTVRDTPKKEASIADRSTTVAATSTSDAPAAPKPSEGLAQESADDLAGSHATEDAVEEGNANQESKQGESIVEDTASIQEPGADQQQKQMTDESYNYGMMHNMNMNGWGNQMAGMDPSAMMAMHGMPGAYGYNMMGMPSMSMDASMMAQGTYGHSGGMGMNTANMNAMNMGMGYGGWGGMSGGMNMNQVNGNGVGRGGYGRYPNGGYIHGNRGRVARQPFPNRHQQNRFRGSGHANWHNGRDQYRHQQAGFDHSGPHVMVDESQYHENGTTKDDNTVPLTVESSDVALDSAVQPDVPSVSNQDIDTVPRSVDDKSAAESSSQTSQVGTHTQAYAEDEFNEDVQGHGNFDKQVSEATKDDEQTQVEYVDDSNADFEASATTTAGFQNASNTPGSSRGGNGEAFKDLGPNVPLGPAAQFANRGFRLRGRSGFRGRLDSRGSMRGRDNAGFVSPAGTGVIGAPTGPKALREGRSNMGIRGGAARGGRGAMMGPIVTRQRQESFGTSAPPTGPAADRQLKSPHASRQVQSRDDRVYEDGINVSGESDFAPRDQGYERCQEEDTKATLHSSSSRIHHQRDYADTNVGELDFKNVDYHESSDLHGNNGDEPSRRHRTRSPLARDEDRGSGIDYSKRSGDVHHSRSSYNREDKRSIDLDSANRYDSRADSRSPIVQDDKYEFDSDYNSRHEHRNGSSRTKSKQDSSHHRERPREGTDADGHRHSRRDRKKDRDRSRSPRREAMTIPTGPAPKEFKIHGRSKRSELDVQKEIVHKEKPSIDAHALEREARNRERMLKEQQRRGSYMVNENNGAANANGRKRSIAAVEENVAPDEDGRDKRHRKRKGKGDDRDSKRSRRTKVYDDWDDGNLAAQEQAREAERWE